MSDTRRPILVLALQADKGVRSQRLCWKRRGPFVRLSEIVRHRKPRPMMFMEMLTRPGLGLNEGRFTFFLRPDQSMQLVAVEDIGGFVATIFGDKTRFGGTTLKLASDTVTGRSLESDLSEAAGHPIAYSHFTEEFLAAHPDFAQITASLENGPLADHVNLDTMREMNSRFCRSGLGSPEVD